MKVTLALFFRDSRAVGLLLLFCTLLSLVLSNISGGIWYTGIWHKEIVGLSDLAPNTAGKWVNEFLMAFFFLMAGMEIKRELVSGELSSFKKAILPFGAALGGMVVPALIFIAVNTRSSYVHGWGIPTATDIAFSLGVASLFGKRIPVALKILLMALAIIDDLGAIVVIAVFYGGKIHGLFLAMSGLVYLSLWACNFFKLKPGPVQVVLSLLLWYCVFHSGIEASIVGVLVAFVLPLSVLPIIEKYIYNPVNFLILPLFALANTAVVIPANLGAALGSSIGLGVTLGLVLGKPVGIFLFSGVLVLLKVAKLPSNIQWSQLLGMGMLAGIGFTMSIFTTSLAYADSGSRDMAKIAILASMGASLLISWIYFGLISRSVTLVQPNPVRSIIPDIAIS